MTTYYLTMAIDNGDDNGEAVEALADLVTAAVQDDYPDARFTAVSGSSPANAESLTFDTGYYPTPRPFPAPTMPSGLHSGMFQ